MRRNQAILSVAVIFMAGLLARLPNLGRPVSKHHEFMSALILINTESWKEGGGASNFHYVPVLNYQHPGDKYYGASEYVNKYHDRWYLSLGPGWYILPYLIFRLPGLEASPLILRVLNLAIGLLSLAAFFGLCEDLSERNYFFVTSACFLFVFSPGALWYTGNGYTHTAVMLPVLLCWIRLMLPALSENFASRPMRLATIFLLSMTLVYFDWIILFMIVSAVIVFLTMTPRNRNGFIPVLFSSAGACAGALLIFLQFSSYGGIHDVLSYWTSRFAFRSLVNQQSSIPAMLTHLIFFHGITAFLPQILLVVGGAIWKSGRLGLSRQQRIFLVLYSTGVLAYNLVFLEWSFEHEFSLVPWIPVLAFLGGRVLYKIPGRRRLVIASCYLTVSLLQYYFINRPGNISRDGMPYDRFMRSGYLIRTVAPDYKIFTDLEKSAPMIEYYARRNIFRASSYEDAKREMELQGIKKGVWVDQRDYVFRTFREIR